MPTADLPPQPSFTVEEASRASEEEAAGLVSGGPRRRPCPNPADWYPSWGTVLRGRPEPEEMSVNSA